MPAKAHPHDAGFDLSAVKSLVIKKGCKRAIPLGIASEFPEGYLVSFRDRSGLAIKHGLHVLAGVIDSGYRGEWQVIIINLGEKDYKVGKGERIAQAILHQLPEVEIIGVKELSETKRGKGGFGSSGRK